MYTATREHEIRFNMLHDQDKARLRRKLVSETTGREVHSEHIVKGYEFAKDQYVVFTPEELKSLEERATQTIDITEFVPQERVDPVFFDKPYYLAPEKGGEKAYHLLAAQGDPVAAGRRCPVSPIRSPSRCCRRVRRPRSSPWVRPTARSCTTRRTRSTACARSRRARSPAAGS